MSELGQLRVLVIEPDPVGGSLLVQHVEAFGHAVQQVHTAEEMLTWLAQQDVDVVLFRLGRPGEATVQRLTAVRRLAPAAEVVVVAAQNATREAIDAVRDGAHGFLIEPYRVEALEVAVGRAAAHRRLRQAHAGLQTLLERAATPAEPVGRTPAFRAVLDHARRIAPTSAPVLFTGELGTGKRHLAAYVHSLSGRGHAPVLLADCAALTEGAWADGLLAPNTPAATPEGPQTLLQALAGGTLILAHIDRLPQDMQARVLPLLEAADPGPVVRARQARHPRILATSTVDLAARVAAGSFRKDLYYHLNSMELRVPPLRERLDDLEELAGAFLKAAPGRGKPKRLTRAALQVLARYPWPGNVWELRNVIQRAALLCDDSTLDLRDLTLSPLAEPAPAAADAALRLAEAEQLHIDHVLRLCDGNKTRAAQALGITPKTLYNKLHAKRRMEDSQN